MARTVVFVGTRADVTRVALRLAAILAGKERGNQELARGFMLVLGFAALSDIKTAFLAKAAGGTGEDGVKWKPLSPVTIANRRVGPRDRKNDPAIALREKIRKRETAKALKRYRLSLPEDEARRRAAIVGGLKATKATGLTKVMTLGGREVEILRDTGVLLNSLSPGVMSGSNYSKPGSEGGDEQIFNVIPGAVIVGTNVAYASTHQHGDEDRKIPARPFLPVDDKVPDIWFARWNKLANKALLVIAEILYRQGG